MSKTYYSLCRDDTLEVAKHLDIKLTEKQLNKVEALVTDSLIWWDTVQWAIELP